MKKKEREKKKEKTPLAQKKILKTHWILQISQSSCIFLGDYCNWRVKTRPVHSYGTKVATGKQWPGTRPYMYSHIDNHSKEYFDSAAFVSHQYEGWKVDVASSPVSFASPAACVPAIKFGNKLSILSLRFIGLPFVVSFLLSLISCVCVGEAGTGCATIRHELGWDDA